MSNRKYTKVDLRLQYANEFGHGLQHATNLVEKPFVDAHFTCPECGDDFIEGSMASSELIQYVEWLEQIICDAQQLALNLNQQ